MTADASEPVSREVDYAIVGAGIAGASLAWRLARHGSVLLLERESQPGYHSTGRSAALFIESYGPPGVRALTRASRDFYLQPSAGFVHSPILAPRGALYVAMRGQEVQLQQLQALLAPTTPQLRQLDAAQTLAMSPVLRADLVHGALYDPDAMDIDVNVLHHGFLRAARALGAVLRCDAAVTGARREGAGWAITLADGPTGSITVNARVLVNAAGAWADELAQACGVAPLGLVPRRRSAFTFDLPPGMDASGWPSVISVDESWYIKPDAGRLLGSPANADDTVPHDVQPEELDIAIGIDAIQNATTLSIRRPASTWAGLRSFVRDGEIVIGADPDEPRFFWLAAQGGYGIQSAAGASALADALLRGVALPDELTREGVDPVQVSPARLRMAG